MKDIRKRVAVRIGSVAAALILTIASAGCSQLSSREYEGQETVQETTAIRQPGIYDSEDAAVVVKKDTQAGTVQFQNIATSRRYTLKYDGTTALYDRNDQVMSMEQLKEGSVVTVRFYKPDKSLACVRENPDCVSYRNVQNYSMNLKDGTLTVGNEVFNISGHVVVVSDGRETDLMSVNQVDVISVWGYQNMIYGINVEQGHGYLRLQNEDYFVGGWIDVGDKVVRKVAEDMLLVVPEGTYKVTVSNKGSSATQEITFAPNEEMAWDLGDVEITVVQKGSIIFTLTPATAKVAIDGHAVDVSKPVTLEYGLHQMRITAEGYDTVAQYIKVAEPSASISVELERNEEETETGRAEESSEAPEAASSDDEDGGTAGKKYQSKASESEVQESTETKAVTESSAESESTEAKSQVASSSTKYKVYIDAPEGAEAYLDGNYVGITPISFNKTAGSHVVTLRKTGYQTRSYTLQIDDEQKDVNYSFTELVKLED